MKISRAAPQRQHRAGGYQKNILLDFMACLAGLESYEPRPAPHAPWLPDARPRMPCHSMPPIRGRPPENVMSSAGHRADRAG